MKKAFTMVELIFVIVILGVLAAVAVPKLNATKDDAKVAKIASDIKRLVSDIDIYFAKNGEIDQWQYFGKITNVPIKFTDGGYWCYYVDDKECLRIIADNTNYVTFYHKESNISQTCKKALNQDGVLVGHDRSKIESNLPENIKNAPIVSFKNTDYFGPFKGIVKYYEEDLW